jgi:hypothetical protein
MYYEHIVKKGAVTHVHKVIVVGDSGKRVVFDFLNKETEPMHEGLPIPQQYRKMQKGEFEILFAKSI